MTGLVFSLVLFLVIGFGFIFVHLVAGKFIRPAKPDAEKLTIYECGEPTIGSAWVQFDLRYYVVALLFVIFDVEVAFFFPWAVVFGHANALAKESELAPSIERVELARQELLGDRTREVTPDERNAARQLGMARLLGHHGFLRRAPGWLRLSLETRRLELGPQHGERAPGGDHAVGTFRATQ